MLVLQGFQQDPLATALAAHWGERAALLAMDGEALALAIAASCEHKAEIVARDPLEKGERALLNFGHTFGHAIETEQGYGGVGNDNLNHGEAVAVGMVLAARLSADLGRAPWPDAARLAALLERLGLPVALPEGLSADALVARMARARSAPARAAPGLTEFLTQPRPVPPRHGRHKGKHRPQCRKLALGKGFFRPHQRQGNHGAVGQIDEIGDLFGQPGLGIVVAVIFPLLEPIRRHVAQAVKPGRNLPRRRQIERVQQIRAGLIIGDKDLALAGGEIVVKIKRPVRPDIAKHHRIGEGRDLTQQIGQGS